MKNSKTFQNKLAKYLPNLNRELYQKPILIKDQKEGGGFVQSKILSINKATQMVLIETFDKEKMYVPINEIKTEDGTPLINLINFIIDELVRKATEKSEKPKRKKWLRRIGSFFKLVANWFVSDNQKL